jgi:hypothetical protein
VACSSAASVNWQSRGCQCSEMGDVVTESYGLSVLLTNACHDNDDRVD